jgi:integrase
VPTKFKSDASDASSPGHNQTIHSLRPTFLTMLNISGVSDELVARMAGHAKKTVTTRHYVAKDLPLLHEAVLTLPLPHEVDWARA